MRRFEYDLWASKTATPEGIDTDVGDVMDVDLPCGLYTTRGKRDAWDSADWPPQRVRVTIEWLDAEGDDAD